MFVKCLVMPKIDHDTKEKILIAAEKVFHANGFRGTRTTMIAEEAGISRTMLHYYYSTKEALFQEVLNKTLGTVLRYIKQIFTEDKGLEALVGHLVNVVADIFEEKPGFPSFLVNILNESPDIALFMAASQEDNIPRILDNLLQKAKDKGEISTDMTGEDIVINIYALCSLPYLGAVYIKAKENLDDEAFKAFVRQRREKTKTLLIKGLK